MAFSNPHLLRHPDSDILLPPLLLPPPAYFAAIAAHRRAFVLESLPYDKRRKATHRFEIADTRGRLQLTVPIIKPQWTGRPAWHQVLLSSHGDWQEKHLTALESAYGRTPFFEFYIDRFAPLFAPGAITRWPTVTSFSQEATRQICSILGIDPPEFITNPAQAGSCAVNRLADDFTEPLLPPYYQVRAHTLGFIAPLSTLDLIFNIGPGSPLLMR